MVDELSMLANEIVREIEREDAFDHSKKQGGFIKLIKAKDIKKVFLCK